MKIHARILALILVFAVVAVPFAALSDQMATPVERKVPPGTTVVHYAGQDLRFTTPVALLVRLEPVTTTKIRLRVSAYPGTYPPPAGSSAQTVLEIFWQNFGNSVYEGAVPPDTDPFEGILLTESGFTEK